MQQRANIRGQSLLPELHQQAYNGALSALKKCEE